MTSTLKPTPVVTRNPLHQIIYTVIRDYGMGNMVDEDGYPYPLVDLMSNPAPADISTGEKEMDELAFACATAVAAWNHRTPYAAMVEALKELLDLLPADQSWPAILNARELIARAALGGQP